MSKQSPTLYDKVDNVIVKILKYVSYISGVCLIAIMFVAFFNVLGEKIFHKGIPASTEIIQYLHIPVVFLACGYVTLDTGHTKIDLLAKHPEGIVLYDRRQPHAVLLTDYTDGVFYCSDPAGSVSSGRVPISAASISIAGASCYWYISSDHNSAVAMLDSLRLEGMRYPVNIRTGKVEPGSNVVFWHTGGATALFAEQQMLGDIF